MTASRAFRASREYRARRPSRARLALLASALLGVILACAPAAGISSAPAPVMQTPPDSAAIAAADSVLVRFSTTKGDIDVMLRRSWAPNGAPRVAEAVAAGYYDNARFFRALRGFVVQWGIAADTVTGNRWRARRIPDDTVRESNRRGTVTFAAGGANTRTVQLFINLRDNARLDATSFAPVGEVVRGMDVVDALYTGYGEGAPAGNGPTQGKIGAEGEAYLAKDFPLLDQIRAARVVRGYPLG